MTEARPARLPKILVVDDEATILQTLRFNLERNGYAVCTAGDGRQALSVVETEKPDLVLLDIMLPVLDGIDVCREIRRRSTVPVLMLTAKDQEIDKVLGLEIGADDYITKPFSIYELLARVKAHLRRLAQPNAQVANSVLRGGPLELEFDRQRVTKSGKTIDLAPKEFGLLHVLLQHKGRVVTRQVLLDRVWVSIFTATNRRSTSTSAGCGKRSRMTPTIPSTSSRFAAGAISSETDRERLVGRTDVVGRRPHHDRPRGVLHCVAAGSAARSGACSGADALDPARSLRGSCAASSDAGRARSGGGLRGHALRARRHHRCAPGRRHDHRRRRQDRRVQRRGR